MIKNIIGDNLLYLCALCFMCLFLPGCSSGNNLTHLGNYNKERFSDFLGMTKSGGGQIASRIESADKLYRNWGNGGEAWVVLVLSEPLVLDDYFTVRESRTSDVRVLADARNQILINLIESIESDVPPSILWALTLQLSNEDRAKIMFGKKVNGDWVEGVRQSESVRDIARSKLKSILGEDHGYSVGAWRNEIIWQYLYTATDREGMTKPAPHLDYMGGGLNSEEIGQ